MVSILSAFKNPDGVPSASPMLQIALGVLSADSKFKVVVPPAVTATLDVATSSSPLYNVTVYVLAFIDGEVYDEPLAVVQYCSLLFAKPTTAVNPEGIPEMDPLAVPRLLAPTAPPMSRSTKKERSRLELGLLPEVKTSA